MAKKTVLGMSSNVFYVVCSVLAIGIIIGSFYDCLYALTYKLVFSKFAKGGQDS